MIAKTHAPEFRHFQQDHPAVRAVDLLVPDLNGVLRGKRVQVEVLEKVFDEGIALPGSLFAMDITGATVEETGLGFDEGDADRTCRPVAGTLVPTPWQARPMGQLLMQMFELDGLPFFADPRQVLKRIIERFGGLGLRPVIALEMEFYLLDQERLKAGVPQPPVSPLTAERESSTQVYGIAELDAYGPLLENISASCKAQGIPADGAVAEYAPGQYEINLQHVDDPLLACDHAVLLKRLIKGEAARSGMEATFMAKPYPRLSGSGMHVHISLVDDKGQNVLAGDDLAGSTTLKHMAGGLNATMAEFMAIFAPNANSYRRFQPGAYVPMTPAWGINNRTTALRIPSGPDASRRIEHRVAGADANPYLLVAALLAGSHFGIDKKVDPGPLLEGNAYDQLPPSLPLTWLEALRAFESGPVARDYLGADFCKVFLACKHEERKKFRSEVSPLEYKWYLRSV